MYCCISSFHLRGRAIKKPASTGQKEEEHLAQKNLISALEVGVWRGVRHVPLIHEEYMPFGKIKPRKADQW